MFNAVKKIGNDILKALSSKLVIGLLILTRVIALTTGVLFVKNQPFEGSFTIGIILIAFNVL